MDINQLLKQFLQQASSGESLSPTLLGYQLGRIALVLVIAYLAARLLRTLVTRSLRHAHIQEATVTLIGRLTFYGILGVGMLWALAGFGLSIALLTVVLGFALQDIIQNFSAGLVVQTSRPFLEGDWVQINNYEGIVANISWRATRIDTFDGPRVFIPNSQIITNIVVNKSAQQRLRSLVSINVDAQSDLARVEEVILQVLATIQGVEKDPPPSIVVTAMSGPAVNLLVRFWTRDAQNNQMVINSTLLRGIKEAFSQNGIVLSGPLPPLPVVGGSSSKN